MYQPNNYYELRLEVKATLPGSLSSFLYAYCKTLNYPERLERCFIRKAVSFVKLAKYVRLNITNDFDGWYRQNEDSQNLCNVLSAIINAEENRIEIYKPQPARLVSSSFRLPGLNLDLVLVSTIN